MTEEYVDINNLPVHNTGTVAAFDTLPMLDVIRTLEAALFGGHRLEWQHNGHPLAKAFWDQRERADALLPYVRGLLREFATRIGPLNNFLKSNGFDPMFFNEFGPKEAGAVTISRRFVRYKGYEKVKVKRFPIPGLGEKVLGFVLEQHQYRVYRVGGGSDKLIEVLTTDDSEDTLWVLPHDARVGPERLHAVALDAMSQQLDDVTQYYDEGIFLPNIVFRAKPDLSPLVGSKVEMERTLREIVAIAPDVAGAFPGASLDEVVKVLLIALTEVHQEFIHLRSREGAASMTASGAAVVLSGAPEAIVGPQMSWFTPKYRDVDRDLRVRLRKEAILAPFWTEPDLSVWGLQFRMGDALKKWGGPNAELPQDMPTTPTKPISWALE